MGAEFSPKIAIVDESPIRAAILEEGLRAADSTDVVWIDEMQSVLSRIHALDPHVIDRTGSGLKERSVIDRAKGILMKEGIDGGGGLRAAAVDRSVRTGDRRVPSRS